MGGVGFVFLFPYVRANFMNVPVIGMVAVTKYILHKRECNAPLKLSCVVECFSWYESESERFVKLTVQIILLIM